VCRPSSSGIGRYGASQLSDVVVAPDGSLSPIKAVHALGGVVVHLSGIPSSSIFLHS
jgi:hypothetical protein